MFVLNILVFECGVEVLFFFNFVWVLNDGVSFGMLGGIVLWWGFIVFVGVIVVWLLIWLWCVLDRLMVVVFGLIIGGVFGNVFDWLCY